MTNRAWFSRLLYNIRPGNGAGLFFQLSLDDNRWQRWQLQKNCLNGQFAEIARQTILHFTAVRDDENGSSDGWSYGHKAPVK